MMKTDHWENYSKVYRVFFSRRMSIMDVVTENPLHIRYSYSLGMEPWRDNDALNQTVQRQYVYSIEVGLQQKIHSSTAIDFVGYLRTAMATAQNWAIFVKL